jgi:hypothetical protein
MAKERSNMYNAVFLLLITLFAIVSGMVGQRAMAIVHAPNTVEGFGHLGELKKIVRSAKNRAVRQVSSAVDGQDGFTPKQLTGILSLAGLGRKSDDDDSEGE